MNFLATFKHSIFFRIYAGLLIVCLAVALFAFLLFDTVNAERAAAYRDEMATGTFSIVAEGVSHHKNPTERVRWITNASNLFGSKFRIIPIIDMDFTANEIKRLEKGVSVVRFLEQKRTAFIYHRVPGEDNVVNAKLNQVSEQQVRALGIFLLNDLSAFSSFDSKQSRLAEISKNFPFTLSYIDINAANLDDDQITRLQRNEIVIGFKDSTSIDSSYITMVVPTEFSNKVIEVGPVKLFNWFPLDLVISVVLISMFLISLGVYALIFPLEKKLQLVQSGLKDINDGKLDTKVQVVGEDEIAQLSATFNSMAQHIKRLIDAQRELTRAVSHELRTPVARIRFAVDMLADTEDESSREQQRDFIDEDIEALNSLIDEILTYAKLEEGSPKLDWEMVSLHELLTQIVKETNALGKPIKIVSLPPPIKVKVEADKRYLHRVVQNLVGNALRYANKKIIISAGVQKGVAFVSVEDDGQGIETQHREKVFIPFARLDDSRTRSSGGYGLGLSIVSRICFWFNGNMIVDKSSRLGGAKFVMQWPEKQLTQTIVIDEVSEIAEK